MTTITPDGTPDGTPETVNRYSTRPSLRPGPVLPGTLTAVSHADQSTQAQNAQKGSPGTYPGAPRPERVRPTPLADLAEQLGTPAPAGSASRFGHRHHARLPGGAPRRRLRGPARRPPPRRRLRRTGRRPRRRRDPHRPGRAPTAPPTPACRSSSSTTRAPGWAALAACRLRSTRRGPAPDRHHRAPPARPPPPTSSRAACGRRREGGRRPHRPDRHRRDPHRRRAA